MKQKVLYLFLFISTTLLFSCKKYPEGGWHYNAFKHLAGTWQLKQYLVNGVDSTDLTLGATSIPDYKSKFAVFGKAHSGKRAYFGFNSHFRIYEISINTKKRDIIGFQEVGTSQFDSTDCYISNSQYCQQRIFCPGNSSRFYWKIEKLTKKDLILISETGDYKLVMYK